MTPETPDATVPRPEPLKRSSEWPIFQWSWGAVRRQRLHHHYSVRREAYAAEALRRGLVYREAEVETSVRARLSERGITPQHRSLGDVHTFAFIPRVGGNAALYPDLFHLGPVTEFDYVTLGHTLEDLRQTSEEAGQRRLDIAARMLDALRRAHRERPVDWVFAYANGSEIDAAAIRRVGDELGIPTVNMCLDDKQSWTGPLVGNQRMGQVDLAPVFDLSWTSARVACEWYLVEGGRPLYQPEGFDASVYHPMEVEQDIPMSFVGAAYGYRPAMIRHLARFGIPVQTFGPGWASGWTWGEDQVRILNRSRINLGMGGIGFSESLTNVKSRDFEIPGAGGGAYLTSFSPDLAEHYVVGREILCYSSRDELVELARWYLARPEETRQVADAGRARCLREHRWLHRYQRILRILGVLPSTATG